MPAVSTRLSGLLLAAAATLVSSAAVIDSSSASASPAAAEDSASASDVAYIVSSTTDPSPLLAYRTGNTSWQQVFNPTWVAPTAATNNRSGLLVRSQNCTLVQGQCGHCSGTGQKASWLTWAELDETIGAVPRVTNFVGEAEAVFGPFDCEGVRFPRRLFVSEG